MVAVRSDERWGKIGTLVLIELTAREKGLKDQTVLDYQKAMVEWRRLREDVVGGRRGKSN